MHSTISLTLLLLIAVAQADQFLHLQFFEFCRSLDYPVEDHTIPTDDHYNLQFYRIQAKHTKITPNHRVIFLQHGLFDSSDTWIVNDEHLAPAFVLANKGFDVWVGNNRGNRYNKAHQSPSAGHFWNFTFNQMADYDLPAAFSYITGLTGSKIHYIGHSQGTLSMFIALSKEIEVVRDNLLSFHAFGPVAYVNHQKSTVMSTLAKTDIAALLKDNHKEHILMSDKDALMANYLVCKTTRFVCAELLLALSDSNNTVNNMARMPVAMAHFPSGSSTKNVIHFQQFIRSGEFKNYDYGERKNLQIYKQKTPPLYDLSKITTPVHLYVGKYDKLADVADSEILFKKLTHSEGKTSKVYEFGHATFIWGKSIEHLIDVMKVIEAVEPEMVNAKE